MSAVPSAQQLQFYDADSSQRALALFYEYSPVQPGTSDACKVELAALAARYAGGGFSHEH